MTCILITGMSGVGKSAVISGLRALGFRAIDMDEEGWSMSDVDGNQRWNLPRLHQALASRPHEPLFVSGCSEDQVQVYDCFQSIILLSAPAEVMQERIHQRQEHTYGQMPEQWARILQDKAAVEPLLRQRCTLEIVTTVPLDEVIRQVLVLASAEGDRSVFLSDQRE